MKIKEVEKMLQMNSQTIRYYDKLGFLNPSRDENGYRNYSLEDITILKKIRFLRELDISLDNVERILKNQNEFQGILDQHINTLQTQVESLEDIRQRCKDLSKKSIPLLDAVVEGEFFSDVHTGKQFNEIVKNVVEFMSPYPAITIGRKTSVYQFIKATIMILILSACVGLSVFSYFSGLSKEYSFPWLPFIVFVIIVGSMTGLILFQEKYYEFRDVDFYVYNSKGHKIKGMLSVLKNDTRKYADHYFYKNIAHVVIRVDKKYRGIGYGVEKCFDVVYKFVMKNGKKFEINSSIYNKEDQDRKSVHEILEYHQVPIIDKNHFRNAIVQTELSLYDYLDSHI